MASVPITVLLCDGPLLCGFNVAIKGLMCQVEYWFNVHNKNNKLVLQLFLQDNPAELTAKQSAITDFYVAQRYWVMLMLSSSQVWHASKQYCRNGTLKESR